MELNNEQSQASTFAGKHLLVLAGAGTGKTRTIIARAKFLIDQGVSPRKIKILSFTKKSAREIVERIKIESSSNSDLRDLSGSTFHSWCMEIMKSHPNIFKSANYTCLDEDDRENAFGLIMGDVIGKKTLKISDSFRLKPDQLVDVYSYAINVRTNLKRAINIKLYSNDDGDLGSEKEQEVEMV